MRKRSGVAAGLREMDFDSAFADALVMARCPRSIVVVAALVLLALLAGCAVGVGPDDPDARHARDATSTAGDHAEIPVDVAAATDTLIGDSPPPPIDARADAASADAAPVCGDSFCTAGETCTICPRDCGVCTARCGDGTCNGGETCSTCAADCGSCLPRCGDHSCNGGETCTTCAADCGACAPRCGDGTCNPGETCSTCTADCGACAARCGDGICNGAETCSGCQADCGACPPRCGDGSCNGGETCSSCAGDCGACPPPCGEMRAGRMLSRGDSIRSCDGRFLLAMQSDGNLVLYQSGSALWSTMTGGTAGSFAAMQSDGNLVLYNGSGGALWSSVTAGNPGAYLAVQTDGNLVVYSTSGSALWSSATCCH